MAKYVSQFRSVYRARTKLSSRQLSLMTPYIHLRPMLSQYNSDSNFITKSVKAVQIQQDSDVIVFNKIVAEVEFVPQGKIKNVTYDKYNFMDYTNAIFNQGSVWILTVGWTGPDSLTRGGHRGVLQYYTTQRTLLKNNIVLMGNKYVGTLQFCRCSFEQYRDTVIPIDRLINVFLPKSKQKNKDDDRYLTDKDYIFDALVLNRTLNYGQLKDQVDRAQKKYQDVNNRRATLVDNVPKYSLDSKVDVRGQTRGFLSISDKTSQQYERDKKVAQDQADNLQKSVLGVRWRTIRYVIAAFTGFLFDNRYHVYINRQSTTRQMNDFKKNSNSNGKYYAPARVEQVTKLKPDLFEKHILHQFNNSSAGGVEIRYMLDYKTDDDPDVKGMIDNSTWNEQRAYVFNDRGDVLIDLYKFNEKVRQSNFLQRLADINRFKMPGFPQIIIKFDDPFYAKGAGRIKNKQYIQVISILWSYPFNNRDSNFPALHIYYDNPTQLFNNFRIQTPNNDQMLKINETNIQVSASGSGPERQKQQLVKGVINSIKRITVPKLSGNVDSQHMKFKHQMYRQLVHKMNGTDPKSSVFNSKSPVRNIRKGKIAGALDLGNGFVSYYFSSTNTLKAQTELNALTKASGASSSQGYDTVHDIELYLAGRGHSDISGKLISYLSNSLNISFDVHGLFNIPVFRSHVVTHGFPGPLVQTGKNKWVRWIDGKYIITHQKTRVDRSTIKTTIKRKRLPDPIPDEPAPKQTQESKDIIDFYIQADKDIRDSISTPAVAQPSSTYVPTNVSPNK